MVLLLADSVTGLLWPPLVAEREDQAAPSWWPSPAHRQCVSCPNRAVRAAAPAPVAPLPPVCGGALSPLDWRMLPTQESPAQRSFQV